MKIFHLKSVLLGIGIGIILTSVVGMVYSLAFRNEHRVWNEEIKRMDRQLGLTRSAK